MATSREIEYKVLGPIEAIVDGEPTALPPMQRKLLALLLIEADRFVSNDHIVDVLWGERPPAAVSDAVRFHISRLRRGLSRGGESGSDGNLLVAGHGGYRLNCKTTQIDAHVFESLVDRASGHAAEQPREAVKTVDEALALWQGPPFADVAYEEFAVAEIRRLGAMRLRARELRIDLLFHLGCDEEVIRSVEQLVVEYPFHESFVAALISSLNRCGRMTEALAAYQAAADQFRTDLGVQPPDDLQRLARESRALVEDPTWVDPENPRHNIPKWITSYTTRGGEIEWIRNRITSRRLVTLVGPGGVGKTRLAAEAVSGLVSDYQEGIWFVDLVPARTRAEVVMAVARAIAIPDTGHGEPVDELVAKAARADLLLVFDNCEHVVAACAELAERLLASSPFVRILATSREPLGLQGEVVVSVEPLEVPDADAGDDETWAAPAVRLFADRAQDSSQFKLGEADVGSVVALLRRLAGIPLAIEMAAARIRGVPMTEITAQLNSHLGHLESTGRIVPDRHRSLDAAFRWSYDLLSSSDQELFRRLGVFTGGFSLSAVAAVAGVDPSPAFVDRVAHLLDVSLVDRVEDRYRMLVPIREFAWDLLEELGELDEALDAHLSYYSALASEERAVAGGYHRSGVDRFPIAARVGADADNYRAALRCALDSGNKRAALEIATCCSLHLQNRLAISEMAALLSAAVDLEGEAPTDLMVEAMLGLAWALTDLGDNATAEDEAGEALRMARNRNSEEDESFALFTLANVAFERGDVLLARDRVAESIAVCRTVDPTHGKAIGLAILDTLLGNIGAAEELLDKALTKPLDTEDRIFIPRWRGFIEHTRGNHDAALALFQEGVAAATTDRTRHEGLRFVAYAHLNLGDLESARVVGEYLHVQARRSGVPTYRERTSNLLGLVDVRQGLPGAGLNVVSEALSGAVARGDRYRAWSFLYSAAEAQAALSRSDAAQALLHLAADLETAHGYWVPALDWVPAVDLAQLETSYGGTLEPPESLQSAAALVRSAAAVSSR